MTRKPGNGWKESLGKQLGGTVDYGDPVVIRDDRDGSVTLYTKYGDYQAYQPVPMDEELKDDIIRAMGKTAYYEEPFAHYHIGYSGRIICQMARKDAFSA